MENSVKFRIDKEARDLAVQERLNKIDDAIKNGAQVNYITCPISLSEKETIIINDGSKVTIDTTINRDMTKCLKNNYKIVSVTLLKNEEGGRVVGLTFEAARNKISFRK